MLENVAYAALRKAMEVCSASNLQYHQWYNPHRLQLIGTDMGTVDQGIQMVLRQISLLAGEVTSQASGSTLRRVRSRGISLSERVMDFFRR